MAKAQAQKKVSARDRYKAHKQQAAETLFNSPPAEGEKLHDFTAPSGMEFKLRRPNLQMFFDAGFLPQGVATKLAQMKADGTPDSEMQKALTPREQAQVLAFDGAVIRYICVDPRIVENPQEDDEIGFDDVTLGDAKELRKWAMGGGEAAKLGNFPGAGRKLAVAGPDVPRVGGESEPAIADRG